MDLRYFHSKQLFLFEKMCRHGDRNIHSSYPTDPWKSLDHWTDGGGFAKLTNVRHIFLFSSVSFQQFFEDIFRFDSDNSTSIFLFTGW